MWQPSCCIITVVTTVWGLGLLPAAAERPAAESSDSLDLEGSTRGSTRDVRLNATRESTSSGMLQSRHKAGLQLSFDWMFQMRNGRCESHARDSSRRRVDCGILALCFSLAAAAVVCVRCNSFKLSLDLKKASADPGRYLRHNLRQDGSDADDEAVPPEAPRLIYLDFARVLCVAFVVAEHSGGSDFSDNNFFFVQQWVMPLLYFTSGACFALSRKPLSDYLFRCLVIFVLGLGANWVADVRTGRDWRADFGNTVFQMGYVALIAVLAILMAPLRHAFQQRNSSGCSCLTGRKPGLIHRAGKPDFMMSGGRADADRSSSQGCTCCCGRLLHPCSLPAFLVISWGLAMLAGLRYEAAGMPLIELTDSSLRDGWQMQGVLGNSPLIVASVAGQVFLCSLSCLVGMSGWLGWILLATIFLPRVFVPWQDVGKSHNVELYILGLAVHMQPLRGQRVVARLVQSYWPFFLCVMMLLGMPKMRGRGDLNPLETYEERLRFYFVEVMIVACFACGCFGVSDPCRVAGLLNWWALFAYCSHVALYRLFESPWGAALTYGALLPIYVAFRFFRRSSKAC
eukprot:TRINITY_DN42877_c0_g1_i1.p1 TRINITY_DN42877_c0_g1~~TRINITY_DN42877_c0_g1_i1.p1  ORF type:complete len:570 (+),score=77.75 TRINITY_DN42877_c0_g1_i1:120-1829(+)